VHVCVFDPHRNGPTVHDNTDKRCSSLLIYYDFSGIAAHELCLYTATAATAAIYKTSMYRTKSFGQEFSKLLRSLSSYSPLYSGTTWKQQSPIVYTTGITSAEAKDKGVYVLLVWRRFFSWITPQKTVDGFWRKTAHAHCAGAERERRKEWLVYIWWWFGFFDGLRIILLRTQDSSLYVQLPEFCLDIINKARRNP